MVRLVPLLLLLLCLVVAGCADSDKRSDDNRFGGAYGGVTGGSMP
jgi:hypothetical protein